jgi:nucleotide-binding universal stress UspA family protein
MKILLATDGSGHGDAAVDAIARWRYAADSDVRIISVVEPPYVADALSGAGVNTSLYIDLENMARERARAAVDKAAGQLRAHEGGLHLNVTTDVLDGSPKRVILEDADTFGADLIIVGSHGHGMLERFLLGSVSQAVALHAKCSVEIVRNPIARTHART